MSDTYAIKETLLETATVSLYRGVHLRDEMPVIIKAVNTGTPESYDSERLRHEYEITRWLESPFVLKPFELKQQKGQVWLILEDFDGIPLSLQFDRPLDTGRFIEIALRMTTALADIHRRGIVHKDLNPENILYDPRTGAIKLTGFGIATRLMYAHITPAHVSLIEGSLSYISPEQTGRMNRPVDYHTDFYSFGIIFYKLLTGQLPFTAEDAMGLVHCHIAGIPVPPHEVHPTVLPMLSKIVLKLMSKMAEDRYQNALGLEADLELCQRNFLESGTIAEFEPGLQDFSEKLQIPHKLYGREEEIERLFEIFRNTCSGKRELLLISGYAGVGKTALVEELNRPITEAKGYFIEGKFDQLQRNIPYFGWIQAFGGFVNTLLMENEEHLAEWKERILLALGNIGRVLTDIIPNLERIIGPQPEIPTLGSREALNRMNYAFLEFLRVIATEKHPLVIFLDDLQWIDTASLNLMQTLFRDSDSSHILIVGAYRDNEIDATHPLSISLELLQKEQVSLTRMTLQEISETAVNKLISRALHTSPDQTLPLTRLIYSKAGGNPFFIRQMLKTLGDRKALVFDATNRRWKWDISQLGKMEISDNVVSLMLGKIRQLSSRTQHVLSLAACVGFRFDVYTLGIISEQTEDTLFKTLQSAFHEGLIVLIDAGFQFAHDRIQQAAYSLIPDEEKKKTHLKIGKLLLGHIKNTEHDEQFFTVMDHLNVGSKLITNRDERVEFAGLNLQAGLKAKASAAFSAASKYFEAGVGLLEDRNWETNYELTIALFNASAEVESLLGNYERARMLFETVLSRAKDPVDTAGVYQARINILMSQGKLNDAIDCGLELVDRLGIHLKPHPTPEDVFRSMKETMALYDPENIQALIDLPEMTDPTIRTAMNVMDSLLGPSYSGRPFLNANICFEQIKLIIQHGSLPSMMVSFTAYALRLCALPFGDIDQGYEFSRLCIALAERENAPVLIPKVIPPLVGYLWPYKRHMRDVLDILPPHYPAAKEVGDFEFAGYVITFYASNAYFAGKELSTLEREIASYVRDMDHIRSEVANRFLISILQSLQNLLGKSECPWILDGEACNRQELLRALQDTQNAAGQCGLHVNTLLLCYIFDRYEEGLIASNLAEEQRAGMLGLTIEPIWFFYDSLTRLALCPNASDSDKEAFLERVAANQAYLELRAHHAPMNYLNKWHLVEAEKKRVFGDDLNAIEHYDRAILLARENGFIQEEALTNELAAKFWLARGKEGFARLHMEQARQCYESWGATSKIRDLDKKYPNLLVTSTARKDLLLTSSSLDIDTIIKTARTISGEMEMERLLEKVIRSVMENAGAGRGFLLMKKGEKWNIVVHREMDGEEKETRQPMELDRSNEIAAGVVHFVSRSKQTVVLDDAANRGNFVDEPVIKTRKSKSLLCEPLMSRGRLLGIIYLENILVTGAFTPERVRLLKILLSQAATSLENANIYEALKESEFRYRQIIETANEGIWMIGPDAITTSVNLRMAQMLGYEPEEMIGKLATDFMDREDRPDHLAKIENRKHGISEHYLRKFVRKDGHIVWTIVSAAPIFDAEKRHYGSFAMFTDITEQKKTEDSLRKSEALLSAVQRISKVGGWEYDIVTGKSFWSDEVYRIHEIPNNPGIDHIAESQKCYAPEDRAIIMEAFQKACEKGEEYDWELPFTTFKGNHLWIRTTAHPVYENGKLVRLIGNLMDITERKRAEEEIRRLNQDLEERVLKRTAQLEAANRELESFAYSISHDLRAPLRHIDGYVNLLASRYRERLDDKGIHYINTVSSSVHRMGTLIDDLLQFSRTGRVEMHQDSVNMNQALVDVLAQIKESHMDRKIEWAIGDLPEVRGDYALLRQVWFNLVENAVKYTRTRDVARIEIGARREGDDILFHITDNGVGFDMKYAGKLFGVFQRLHPLEEFEGTGIGLAIVHRIIARHDGRAWAKSRPGEGATFYFTLPAGREQNPASSHQVLLKIEKTR